MILDAFGGRVDGEKDAEGLARAESREGSGKLEVGRVDRKEHGWGEVDGNGEGETGRGNLEGGNGQGQMGKGAIGTGRGWQWGGGQREEMERGAMQKGGKLRRGRWGGGKRERGKRWGWGGGQEGARGGGDFTDRYDGMPGCI